MRAVDSRSIPTAEAITVAAGARLDFEAVKKHALGVQVADADGLTFERNLTVALSDINEAPRAKPNSFEVRENAAKGARLGRVQATDPDAGDRS